MIEIDFFPNSPELVAGSSLIKKSVLPLMMVSIDIDKYHDCFTFAKNPSKHKSP